jgi:hypothetical protein
LLASDSLVIGLREREFLGPTEMDEFERRSWLVSLAYEVLRDMEPPADDATDMAVLSDLSRAFYVRAAALANREASTSRKSPKPAAVPSHSSRG